MVHTWSSSTGLAKSSTMVTAMAPDMHEAIRQAYEGVSCIRWDGEQHRTDIAARAVMKR